MSTSSKPTWSMELVPGQPMLHKETVSHRVVMADGFNSSTLRREGRSRGSLILRLAWSTEIIPEQARPLYSETQLRKGGGILDLNISENPMLYQSLPLPT